MIKDRPEHLLAQRDYKPLPDRPFQVSFDALPELLRRSLGPRSGIQPITGAMAKAGAGELYDMPSAAEVELFKATATRFQPIFLVINIAHLRNPAGTPVATPYALSLVPASKRDRIDEVDVELIAKLDVQKTIREMNPCYSSFDPFTGDYSLFGPLGSFLGEHPVNCFLDEMGIVLGQYFLAKTYEPEDVLESPIGISGAKAEERYRHHRARLLYKPFSDLRPRRLWGAQSPIELFLLQELLRRDRSPLLQILLFDDGAIHASLYDLWRDIDFRYVPGLITEADIYFPDPKLAVFCDSTRHHRGRKAQDKDALIDEKLAAIGVTSLRVPGKLIVNDIATAANLVEQALG